MDKQVRCEHGFHLRTLLCAIGYHLHNLKNVKDTYGGMLPLVKLQAEARNLTACNTQPWTYFMFLKLS